MRWNWLSLALLASVLSMATSAIAQDELNLNQTYQDVIRLSFTAGKTQIPLPEGEWELLGLQEDQTYENNIIWRVYLARIENDTLLGFIYFNINDGIPGSGIAGWGASSFCNRDNLYYIEVKRNWDGDVDCWAAYQTRIKPNKRWAEGKRQMHNALLARNVSIPRTMVLAVFIRRNLENLLGIGYYFHPNPPGGYLSRDDIKSWGKRWKPKVDAGFAGKLEKAKSAQRPARPSGQSEIAPSSGEKSDIESQLTKLKGLYDRGLITETEYAEKRKELLKGF